MSSDNKIKAEYRMTLNEYALKQLNNLNGLIGNVIKGLFVPLEGYIESTGDNLLLSTQNDKGILLSEIHMEDFVKQLNSHIASLAEQLNVYKEWEYPDGEKYFIRHIEIDKYMARNFTLIKDFPEHFDFVVDKRDKPIPIDKWQSYAFGIENNGKIYLVKKYDSVEVLEKIIPFIAIEKLRPAYESVRYEMPF